MIRIVVDSGADYLPEELEEKQIEMVPLFVAFGEDVYRDGVEITREQFFDRLMQGKEFPHTSQPSPEAFLSIFEKAKERGDAVICITISSALSGTLGSAAIAKGLADYEEIYLVDSRMASAGIQFLADQAVKMRGEGKDAARIVEELEHLKDRIRVYFVVDTLEYLYRGGRLSKGGSVAGKLMHMKPVLSLNEKGEVVVSELCLGSARSIEACVRHLKEEEPDMDFPVLSFCSSGLKNCERLEARLAGLGILRPIRRQIGCVIGAHAGPGAAGTAFVKKE